jgi:16S rRNA (cytidine1402-2'-O)-methyltransferase
MPGTLFVVATPIGNLEDLTFRALRILREVQVIAAEDTRRTAKLLAHYEIRCPMVSLHEHNEFREAPRLAARLLAGESIALVSDAGTPGIADPGARLVRAALDAGIVVTPIPGANAIATALSASGFEGTEFVFMGFPPPKGQLREAWFERLAGERRIVVFFEAPHRVRRTLDEAATACGKRPINVFRELTKLNEELFILPIMTRGEHNAGVNGAVNAIGEFTLVIGPAESSARAAVSQVLAEHLVVSFARLIENGLFEDHQAVVMCAALFDLPTAVVVKTLKKAKIAKNQANRSVPQSEQ